MITKILFDNGEINIFHFEEMITSKSEILLYEEKNKETYSTIPIDQVRQYSIFSNNGILIHSEHNEKKSKE